MKATAATTRTALEDAASSEPAAPIIELTRAVRVSINDGAGASTPAADSSAARNANTFAAAPTTLGLGRFFEFRITCRGRIDPVTGYFVNIKDIDHALRAPENLAIIAGACSPGGDGASGGADAPQRALLAVAANLNRALGDSVSSICWKITPFYSLEATMPDTDAPRDRAAATSDNPPTVLLRQQFEFAASHRLHSPTLSDAENRRIFGKCNYESGHGHNYRVEPCVELPAEAPAKSGSSSGSSSAPASGSIAQPFTLQDLERLTAATIIDRFDHRHLNLDTREFNTGAGGVNPSVENIAVVCFNLLAPEIRKAHGGAKLRSITVWETDKTSATFPAL